MTYHRPPPRPSADNVRRVTDLLRPNPTRRMRLIELRAARHGSQLAATGAELASGLVIHNLRIMAGQNGPWLAMPAQKQVDRDGNPRLNDAGKPIYTDIVSFRNRSVRDRFTAEILALVRESDPSILSGGGDGKS